MKLTQALTLVMIPTVAGFNLMVALIAHRDPSIFFRNTYEMSMGIMLATSLISIAVSINTRTK
ncbi:MAG: hypothetical protein WCV79_04055 [Candidatus Paceibacterota bacterium]